MDNLGKDRLKLLTKESSGKVQSFIGPVLLNILSSNKLDTSIQKELTHQLQKYHEVANSRSQAFEACCVNSVKGICNGEIWNKSAISNLEEIEGLSPFVMKPENTEGFIQATTSSKQELYIPTEFVHFSEQLDSFLFLLAVFFSHQSKVSMLSHFNPHVPEAKQFDVKSEPILIQAVKSFLDRFSKLRSPLDSILREHKESFAPELAVYIHNGFNALVLSVINQKVAASSVSMTMGIEDKLERKQFRFNPSSPLFNCSSSLKRSTPTHTQNHSSFSQSTKGSKSYNNNSNKKQKRNQGFFFLNTSSMRVSDFLSIHKSKTVPSFGNKSVCLKCCINGDNSCYGAKQAASKFFHGPMEKVSKPMLKFASDHSIPLF